MNRNGESFDDITDKLATIRNKIQELNLPESTYAGIGIDGKKLHVTQVGEGDVISTDMPVSDEKCGIFQAGGRCQEEIIEWFNTQAHNEQQKYIAVGIGGDGDIHSLGSRLWLEQDIVPYVLDTNYVNAHRTAQELAHEVESLFDELNISKVRLGDYREVLPDQLVSLSAYEDIISDTEYEDIVSLSKKAQEKTIRFFSATPRGGGVALMRHALIRMARLLDVDMHWHVMIERGDVFEITKTKFHNILQGVADQNTVLTDKDKEVYNTWIQDNVEKFRPVIEDADVIVIDDPQPSGMIPYIQEMNPQVDIIYRSHIHLESELVAESGTSQHRTWEFLWDDIKRADAFVAHPVDSFVPTCVEEEKRVQMPPTTDRLDGLNKPLSERQSQYYMNMFNKVLIEHNQNPLDPERPYIIQIARFDPSKGIEDVLESFYILRETLNNHAPQLVIAGHGSVDDPDGVPMLNLTKELITEGKYKKYNHDIKVARLEHTDQILNALMREAKIGLQLSHKEGFEMKVTEGLMKGVPMIAYADAGGIPLQITHGEGGYLAEHGNPESVAKYMKDLLVDEDLYNKMTRAAQTHIRDDVFTTDGMRRWLSLAVHVLEGDVLTEM